MNVEPAQPDDADALAAIFTAARRNAMPWLPQLHSADDDRRFIAERVTRECQVLVVRREETPIAFIALNGDLVEHLYVAPCEQRRGVGSALLHAAKSRTRERLRLWVFQRNEGALAFYARHGFTEETRTGGAGNEEREPDVLLSWKR